MVYGHSNFWLQTHIFLDSQIVVKSEIRITFLQLVFLLLDLPDSMNFFKQSEVLLHFITEAIDRMEIEGEDQTIEEGLVLLIAHRMLHKDPEYACQSLAIKSCLDKLFEIQ